MGTHPMKTCIKDEECKELGPEMEVPSYSFPSLKELAGIEVLSVLSSFPSNHL